MAEYTLHSTMFLLIQRGTPITEVQKILFTFHNVSINTKSIQKPMSMNTSLHSTMFLLIPVANANIIVTREASLHSTMFLLIPVLHIHI